MKSGYVFTTKGGNQVILECAKKSNDNFAEKRIATYNSLFTDEKQNK